MRDSILKIGIKYCGGCNPRFDRRDAVLLIKTELQDAFVFESAKEENTYDYIIVVGGCTNCCASYERLFASKERLFLIDENDVAAMIDYLKHSV